jgi:BASS family bile acid:Na+ symporter
MVIAAAPGGVTSNLLTSFAKGDVALSISLTAIISLLCVITIPFIVLTSIGLLEGINTIQGVSLYSMSRDMFLIVTVPVILGILLRKFVSEMAMKFEPVAKKISIVLFILVLLGAVAAERENVISYFVQAGLVTLVLNIVMMVVAYYIAQMLASGTAQYSRQQPSKLYLVPR